MTTGIEFVGVILAIVPLCLAALEHQETATRPYKTLFRYQVQYARCVEDLGLYLVELHQTVRLVFRTAGISDDDHFDEILRTLDASFWNDTTQEEKLIAHFGDSQYALGFRNVMKRISKDVWKIWEFLDLDEAWDVRSTTDTVSLKEMNCNLQPL
jgi:hypothetical protein